MTHHFILSVVVVVVVENHVANKLAKHSYKLDITEWKPFNTTLIHSYTLKCILISLRAHINIHSFIDSLARKRIILVENSSHSFGIKWM